jgi:hypothetical protein
MATEIDPGARLTRSDLKDLLPDIKDNPIAIGGAS